MFRNLQPPRCLRASLPRSVETARRRGRLLLLLPRYDHHHSFDDHDDYGALNNNHHPADDERRRLETDKWVRNTKSKTDRQHESRYFFILFEYIHHDDDDELMNVHVHNRFTQVQYFSINIFCIRVMMEKHRFVSLTMDYNYFLSLQASRRVAAQAVIQPHWQCQTQLRGYSNNKVRIRQRQIQLKGQSQGQRQEQWHS